MGRSQALILEPCLLRSLLPFSQSAGDQEFQCGVPAASCKAPGTIFRLSWIDIITHLTPLLTKRKEEKRKDYRLYKKEKMKKKQQNFTGWMSVTLNLEWGKFSQDFFGHNLFLNKTFWLYIMFRIASLSHLNLLMVILRKQIFFNFVTKVTW